MPRTTYSRKDIKDHGSLGGPVPDYYMDFTNDPVTSHGGLYQLLSSLNRKPDGVPPEVLKLAAREEAKLLFFFAITLASDLKERCTDASDPWTSIEEWVKVLPLARDTFEGRVGVDEARHACASEPGAAWAICSRLIQGMSAYRDALNP